ncbi:MAG: hypothetical protein ACE5PV_20365 [Candidatus Poribacteria bacterium]
MKPKFRFIVKTLLLLCLFSSTYNSFAYIERRYTLEEVIESCTNIVFGTIESVDAQKLRAIIKVDEDVLGKSGLEKIKINLAVGQRRPESSPEQMIKHFREGKPAVIFYDYHSGQLNSLGHVGGKWFQCKTYVGKEWEGKNWRDRWWNFTHKEIHMYHAYKGWTVNLQKKVRELVQKRDVILARKPAPGFKNAPKDHIKTLVFSNRKYPTEFRTLRRISKIGKYQFAYQRTYDPNLPELEGADILWIGYRALGEDGYLLNRQSEEKIKKFVKNGGVVIVSGQDNDDGGKHLGWFAGKLRGVESDVQTGIQPKNNASELFKRPNEVATDNIYTEDSWNHWGRGFDVLATTNDKRNVAVGVYKDGKGIYLITSLYHQTFFQVSSNQRLIENLIYFAAEHLEPRR